MICQLTGMDVANACLYDGGVRVAEAVLMAPRHGAGAGRRVAGAVTRSTRQVVETYCAGPRPPRSDRAVGGRRDGPRGLRKAVTDKTACVVIQYPNFFGCLEDLEGGGDRARSAARLLVVSVGSGQPRPAPAAGRARRRHRGRRGAGARQSRSSFGGPYLGMIACRKELVRQMPGRIVGQPP